MKKMRRVGKEIKILSNCVVFIFMIPIILVSVLLYFIGESIGEDFTIICVFIAVFGLFIAWLLTVVVYGYGELIDQTMQTHFAVRDLQNMLFKKLDETNASVSAEVKILTEINKNMSNRT